MIYGLPRAQNFEVVKFLSRAISKITNILENIIKNGLNGLTKYFYEEYQPFGYRSLAIGHFLFIK